MKVFKYVLKVSHGGISEQTDYYCDTAIFKQKYHSLKL